MANFIKKILRRKVLSAFIAFSLITGGYFGYKYLFGADNAVRYITAQVQKDTLIVSISGSGQVSASNQVDLKPKASGEVVYIGASNGQAVPAGTLIVQLDSRDAEKSVRDSEINLASAKLNLEKIKGGQGDDYTLRSTKEKARDDLKKAYDDGFTAVANAFLDIPSIMSGLNDLLFGTDFGGGQWNIDYYTNAVKDYDAMTLVLKANTYNSYQIARAQFDKSFSDYKSVSRFSDATTTETIINQTYDTTKAIADVVKNTNGFIQFYKDIFSQKSLRPVSLADTHLTALSSYTDKTNKHLSNLLSAKTTIQADKEAIASASFSLAEQELTVKQRENALLDAKEKLADYFVRAPFNGIVAKLNVKKGDSVSGATVITTLITRHRVAEISLNEVDVAKIKVGQKATLTFDAVPNLSIAGEVAEIDTLGAVSQGVVSYTVKITFYTQDERVKSGMSVSSSIITDTKIGVLVAPNSAVKSQGDSQYVEMTEGEDLNAAPAANGNGVIFKNPPRRQTIETGLANDELTEIVNGLKEGDRIVTRIIQPNSTQSQTQQQSSGLRIPGLPGGGGGRR